LKHWKVKGTYIYPEFNRYLQTNQFETHCSS